MSDSFFNDVGSFPIDVLPQLLRLIEETSFSSPTMFCLADHGVKPSEPTDFVDSFDNLLIAEGVIEFLSSNFSDTEEFDLKSIQEPGVGSASIVDNAGTGALAAGFSLCVIRCRVALDLIE